jgi:2-C-methyl-D-erythritol 4-phosphate cytidylyltransferase/2-C-methyl-D-erythritol 2,4-cyclodiphosphate synthase
MEAPISADAIVVAAGSSSRMAGMDKLAADLGGRPLLAWSLEAIAAAPLVERIVVVRPPDQVGAPLPWRSPKLVATVAGGARRQDSVMAGVRALELGAGRDQLDDASRVLLVHDGARPLVSSGLVEQVVRAAAAHGAAIPVVAVTETLKRIDGETVTATIDRSNAVAAQTPQGIRWDILRDAYRRVRPDLGAELTDEAALLEAAGITVHVVPGERDNLKVTTPDDLDRARALVAASAPTRTGLGEDGHAFGAGGPLRLGGIDLPGAPRLHGHSDGDAVLHAIANALLGAAALGDLGTLAPADGRTPRDIDSAELLDRVAARLREHGWRAQAVDLTITAGRPRLGGHLGAMRSAIAALLGLDFDAVSVKAATGNLAGDAGAGRFISVRAVATIAHEKPR